MNLNKKRRKVKVRKKQKLGEVTKIVVKEIKKEYKNFELRNRKMNANKIKEETGKTMIELDESQTIFME